MWARASSLVPLTTWGQPPPAVRSSVARQIRKAGWKNPPVADVENTQTFKSWPAKLRAAPRPEALMAEQHAELRAESP